MNNFKPWAKYPSLTQDRLSVIANLISDVRRGAVALHDPASGDSEWSLGCRVYSRTCDAIRKAADIYNWLHILDESENLRFSFAIGDVPFRFYRGKPDEPPERYCIATFGELHYLQGSLPLEGLRPLDKVLRLAVETNSKRQVSTVTFVETDEVGNVTETYAIPFDAEAGESGKVTPLQAKPFDLSPVVLEPLQKPQEESKQANEGDERKLVSE